MKRGAMVASTLALVAIIAAACNQPYSQPPSVTNTPINVDSLFGSTTPDGMNNVQDFATGTSQALTGTPATALVTQTLVVGTPGTETITPTSLITLPTSTAATATATLAVSGTQPTSLPPGSRPSSYLLQKGEFPYCIARRFDVNPEQLLTANNLSRGDIYYPNLTLTIPASAGPFPPPRALRTHPTTYTATAGQTVYGVACVFGDVYPSAIATANNISESTVLTAGQSLSIP
jgi:LysM repeat protein